MKIKPNLFLNMSPQTTEEGGLAFARNMKLDDDGNLVSDYGYKDITSMASYNIVGHIVGLDNKVYFFCHTLVEGNYVDTIVEYDEVEETATPLDTHWSYSDGEIDGYVNTNQSGEKILTIAEYKSNGHVPLKHINLKYPKILDSSNNVVSDETIYNQAPKCPTANLVLTDTYVKTIPNGVYVFFIRYKLRKDTYTNWFLCSRPIFGGTSEKITTLQGGLSYINLHKDSAKSFVFQLDFASASNKTLYKEFQLGFIITHDEATDARAWKHFNISDFVTGTPHYHTPDPEHPGQYLPDENLIYFDYENVEETNIDDLLETTYELYNVRNVTAFKNKLYISNYIESNFNPDISALVSKIHLTQNHSYVDDKNYHNMKLVRGATEYNLVYDNTKGYFTKTDDDIPVYSILYREDFNFGYTKLAKDGSKEKTEIVKFDVIWNPSNDPDIAIVYNIYNELYGDAIFGPDYDVPYEFTRVTIGIVTDWIDEGMGIKYGGGGTGNLWVYIRSSTEHPWDHLGLTFAFGSFKEDEIGKDFARNGCSYFNKYTYGHWGTGGVDGWVTRDSGFSDTAKAAIDNKLKEDIRGKSYWGKAYIEITSGAKIYTIGYQERMDLDNYAGYETDINIDIDVLSDSAFSTDTLTSTLARYIQTQVFTILTTSTYCVGIDDSGAVMLKLARKDSATGTITYDVVRCNSMSIRFKKFDFDLDVEDIGTGDVLNKRYKVSMKTTDYTALCTFNFKSNSLVVTDTVGNAIQASTLMPLSTYQAYIHFVDEHNIVTNGIKLGNTFTTGAALKDDDVLSLRYVVDSGLPITPYKSFFISLINVGNIVIECFGYTRNPNNTAEHIVHCLEVDSMLYNINDNITIVKADGTIVTNVAKYYSSGSNYPPLAFGNCGYISWTESNVDHSSDRLYAIITRNKDFENIDNLPKSSAYIPLQPTSGDTDLPDGYYGSWLCLVKKPSFDLSSSCYVSGKDVYAVDRASSLSLTEFNSYIQVQNSVTYFVRSNYNLNYLSLTEDIADTVFAIGNASSGVKQVAKVINSAILSFIYELKPMYKDFANKFFRRYDSDYKIDFDNTIRVSHVLSDETFNNSVFKFAATDYYNIPTDRGIIVNLFSIGNIIFVHTKDSFYKFDGNQTIAANNSDIQLQESEPFDTGITQIFDSEYGYGGIDTKQSGCITFDSYFFYDKSSNHIFAYGGNSQVQLIDGNIYKLLAYYKPSDCKTLHDELNCRVFFEFASSRSEHNDATYNTFTLSYNYKTKTFVSLHDLSLVNVFAGRHRAYSYKNNGTINALLRLFEIEQVYTHQETVDEETVTVETAIDVTPLVPSMNVNKIFGNASTACIIEFGASLYKKQIAPFGMAIVMFPRENLRETVNSIKYIADIQQKDPETQSSPVFDVLVNPQVSRTNPVVNFYIITDCCVSSVVNTNVNDNARPNTLLDYKGFKFDMGAWTSNYFRNDINKTDIYKYGQKYPNRDLDADQNSLVYGRYFIIIFDFKADTPVKFEELFMNTEKY